MKKEKLKVLLLTEAAGSGVGRHILDLAHGLATGGHEVHLIYSESRLEDRFFQRIKALDGMITTRVIPMQRSINPYADLTALLAIRRYVKEYGPFDIIHGHSSKAGALVRLLKITGAGPAKIVYTPHACVTLSPGLSGKQRFVYNLIERILGSYLTDAIIAVSNHEARHAIELGIPTNLVNTVVNGVGIGKNSLKRREEYRSSLGVAPEDIVIGFSGRLDYQKAPEILIQAYCRLEPGPTNISLVLLGDGPKHGDLEQLVKTSPHAGSIHIAGYHPLASDVLSAFDIFVLPSRYEGLPYVLLEAMAEGLPIVATSVGGNSELVRDKVNGLLVPRDAPDDLSKALDTLIRDSELRQRFSSVSLELVGASYSIEKMLESTVDIYNRLLESRRG
ncbi:MAG TPA: glycosyltransferase family 4 protein [Candidatus Aquicultor sp.]|jgi:glycosyltransferase involved in cell wall biosynthesis